MCTPTRYRPSGIDRTDRQSSISVVVESSMENGSASDSGSPVTRELTEAGDGARPADSAPARESLA
jgi:hypothetical protein